MNKRRLKRYPMAKLSTTKERPRQLGRGYLIPYAEAWESADELLIEIKLPISARSEAIEITFEQGILTIYGLYGWPLGKGRIPNQFYRCFMIPFLVQARQIKACFQPTLLALHLAKGEPRTSDKVAVQVNSEPVTRARELSFINTDADFDFELTRFRFNAV